MRDILTVGLFGAICALAPTLLALAPRSGEPVAVIAAPWAPAASIIVAAADGALIGPGSASLVAVGMSESPDFITRLYRSGAALVLDARAAWLCSDVRSGQPADEEKNP